MQILTANLPRDHKILHPDYDKKAQHLQEVIKFKDHLNPLIRDRLVMQLESTMKMINGYLDALREGSRETSVSAGLMD